MGIEHVAGSRNSLVTTARKTIAANDEVEVVVTGPYALVEAQQPAYGSTSSPCPSGYTVERSTLVPDGRGGGVLTIYCVKYNLDIQSPTPKRTIYEIDMRETRNELKTHPALASDRGIIDMWLASSPSVQYSGSTGFSYTDANGSTQAIASASAAFKFCSAYKAGITTYLKFFPVIKKVSVWDSVPGLSMVGNSQTGGSISQFSPDIGKWDTPPISLNGYAQANWFKSCDRWNGNQDKSYTRTEQWEWTPDGSGSQHGWIYSSSSNSNSNGGGGQ